jgi:shikimate kinase
MRIYLAGFMGSGKSTVGPKVADRLNLGFLDLDDHIESAAGRSIPDIFAEEGEMGFRQRETRALWDTADRDDVVVALGGGTIVDDANREFAKEHGLVIYLRVPAKGVVERVADEADHRPLLQDEYGEPLSREAMRQRIERMLSERRSAYEQADVTVEADRPPDTVAGIVAEIAEVWQHRAQG